MTIPAIDEEQLKLSHISGRSVKWSHHVIKQLGSFFGKVIHAMSQNYSSKSTENIYEH